MSNLIEEAIREYFGERCPDFEAGCPCCRAWAEFDQLNEKAGDWQTMRDERDMCLGNCDGLMTEIECCEHEAQKQASFIHDQNKYIDWLKGGGPHMIDKSKTYRTRDGREVRIYATDGGGKDHIHGAVKNECGSWVAEQWFSGGKYAFSGVHMKDLIEVKPRIKREVWVNVYRQDDGYEFATYHDNATDAWSESGDAIVARACLAIDVEEGEGL